MSLAAVLVVLALAVGVALDPRAVAFVIRLLGGRDGVRKAWACVGGSAAAVALIALAALLFVRLAGNLVINPTHAAIGREDTVALLEGLLGVALVIQALFAFFRGSEGTSDLAERALSDVDAVPTATAFAMGATAVSLTMPVVAGAELTQARGPLGGWWVLTLFGAFLLLAMSTRVAPILVAALRPRSVDGGLAAVRAWIERYGASLAAATTLVLGIAFVAIGAAALVS